MGMEAVVTVTRWERNTFALVLGVVFICASAALASVPPNFSGGSGSAESPYYISSSEDLSALAQRVMKRQSHRGRAYRFAHYIQTADIDLGSIPAWLPIGLPKLEKTHRSFRGVYDGRGHTIANVHCQWYRHPYTIYPYTTSGDVAEDQYYGLFGVVAGDGEKSGIVRNVRVKTRSLYSEIPNKRVFFGMIAGALWGGKIEGCSVEGGRTSVVEVGIDKMKDRHCWVGGVIGEINNDGRIKNCRNTQDLYVQVNDTFLCGGGIVGRMEKGRVEDCINEGRIHIIGGMGGGIAGYAQGRIENCINLGGVDVYLCDVAGGICGVGACEFFRCVNEGQVSLFSRGIWGDGGGLIGRLFNKTLMESLNRGDIYISILRKTPVFIQMSRNNYYTSQQLFIELHGGGLVGKVRDGTIRDSINMGNVSGWLEVEATSADIYLGGVAGACVTQRKHELLIENVLNVGELSIKKMPSDVNYLIGGIVGCWREEKDSKASILGCYWLWDGQGEAHGVGAGLSAADTATTPLNAAAMRRRESFVGWDFEKIWREAEEGMIAPEPASLPRRSFEYER